MKRSMMHLYVQGSAEAVALYQRAFGAALGYHVRNPDGSFYHAEIEAYGQVISLSEACCAACDADAPRVTGNTMQLCFHFGEGEAHLVRQAYEALREGGAILTPLGPCDYSPLSVDLIDRFGVRWGFFV